MKYETTGRVPIKIWFDDIDEKTLDQAKIYPIFRLLING